MSDTDIAPPRVGDGFRALKRYNIGDLMTAPVNGHTYIFKTEANISLAWVAPGDVDAVLAMRGGCNCGGNKKNLFLYANEADVRRWINRGGA